METASHVPILKRTGTVLVIVGVVDIGFMVYCFANRISYSSRFNIFAVVAGVFLLCGNLRAAAIVRWFSMFLLALFHSIVVAWPLIQPIDLTLTEFRLRPAATLGAVAFGTVAVGLLAWVNAKLGSVPVVAARTAAGRPKRNMLYPATAGIAFAALMVAFLSLLLGGQFANHAKSIAASELGPQFRYHVRSLNIRYTNGSTFAQGIVTAWNDKEIRQVPVYWEER